MRVILNNFVFLFLFAFSNANAFGHSVDRDSLEYILNHNEAGLEEIEIIKIRNQLAEYYFKFNVNKSTELINQNLTHPDLSEYPDLQINNLPQSIMVDETKIRQVFQNLIANSLKFTTEGVTPIIKVNCIKEEGFYKFSIEDNGIGIQEEYLDTIFKPYKQLHTKDKFEGTGMGLAICKKIVEKHDGEISAASKLGEGTTFHFTIPTTLSTIKQEEEAKMSEA